MGEDDTKGALPEREDGGDATSTVTPAKPAKPKRKRKAKQLPPYKVLLHNDDENSFDYVILSIMRVANLPPDEAVAKTVEAHKTGLSLLLITHRERAELYQEQFTSVGLTVTIEPD